MEEDKRLDFINVTTDWSSRDIHGDLNLKPIPSIHATSQVNFPRGIAIYLSYRSLSIWYNTYLSFAGVISSFPPHLAAHQLTQPNECRQSQRVPCLGTYLSMQTPLQTIGARFAVLLIRTRYVLITCLTEEQPNLPPPPFTSSLSSLTSPSPP